jgi:hypothetical protein
LEIKWSCVPQHGFCVFPHGIFTMIDGSKTLGCQNLYMLLLWQVEALHSQAKHKIQNDNSYRNSSWFKEIIYYCVMKCSQ